MKKVIMVMGLGLVLTACGGDKAVEVAKEAVVLGGEGMTFAEMTSVRSLCSETVWREVSNPHREGVPMVEYRCTLSGAPEYFAEYRDKYLTKSEEAKVRSNATFEQMIETQRNALERSQQRLEEVKGQGGNIRMAQQAVESQKQVLATLEDNYNSQVQRQRQQIDDIREHYTVTQAQEVIQWEIIKESAAMRRAFLALSPESGADEVELQYQRSVNIPGIIYRNEIAEDGEEVRMDQFMNWRFAANQLVDRS